MISARLILAALATGALASAIDGFGYRGLTIAVIAGLSYMAGAYFNEKAPGVCRGLETLRKPKH